MTVKLSEIEKATEGATPGPWAVWHDLDHQGFKTVGDAASYLEVLADGQTDEANPTAHVYVDADATFIAASRAAIPALTAALRDVLALHQFRSIPTGGGDYEIVCRACHYVSADEEVHLCPTVRAITAHVDPT